MIPQELKDFIEQNCSGTEPSDLLMEAIDRKIEQTGADADEVLAYVNKCAKGPTLEQKAAEAKRKAEAEAERLARIQEAKAKAESDAHNAALAAEKAKSAYAEADAARAKAEEVREQRRAQNDKRLASKARKRTYIVAIVVVLVLAGGAFVYWKSMLSGKTAIELAQEAAYNSVNDPNAVRNMDVDMSDVPNDDPSVVIDPNGDVKAQLEKHYQTVMGFNDGFYKIKHDNLYGLADKTGKVIQRPKYTRIHSRNQRGLIKVEKDGLFGFLNVKGVEVVEPIYEEIESEKDGNMKVKKNGKYGLIDVTTLKLVAPCEYDYISDKADGKYKVWKNSKEGYLNADGTFTE